MFILRHFVVLVLLFQAGQIQADTIEGRVIDVSDGDTITVLDAQRQQHKIRLAGVDAPEKNATIWSGVKKTFV